MTFSTCGGYLDLLNVKKVSSAYSSQGKRQLFRQPGLEIHAVTQKCRWHYGYLRHGARVSSTLDDKFVRIESIVFQIVST